MSAANIEKIVWVMLAVGIYALAEWPPLTGARDGLLLLAGSLPGAAFVRSVSDRHEAKARKSIAPPA